jgi:hypothetical protein
MWIHVTIVALVSAVFIARLVSVLAKRPRSAGSQTDKS